LFKFAVHHNLTIALPPPVGNASENRSLSKHLIICVTHKVKTFLGPEGFIDWSLIEEMPWWKRIKKYDVYVDHARYSPDTLRQIMGKNFKLISIVRDPADRLNSRYSFANFAAERNHSLNRLIEMKKVDVDLLCMHSPVHSFGVECNEREYYNKKLIIKKIKEIDDKFDVVFIQEFMEESVILLKNLLNMSWEDVVQITLNKTDKKERVKRKNREALKRLLWPEYMFYDFFYAKFKTEMRRHAKLLREDRRKLRKRQSKVDEECRLKFTPFLRYSARLTHLEKNQPDFCVKALGDYDVISYMKNQTKLARKREREIKKRERLLSN